MIPPSPSAPPAASSPKLTVWFIAWALGILGLMLGYYVYRFGLQELVRTFDATKTVFALGLGGGLLLWAAARLSGRWAPLLVEGTVTCVCAYLAVRAWQRQDALSALLGGACVLLVLRFWWRTARKHAGARQGSC